VHEKWYKKISPSYNNYRPKEKVQDFFKKTEIKETRQKTDTKAFLQHIPTSKGANCKHLISKPVNSVEAYNS
jgi:hypothetical protein